MTEQIGENIQKSAEKQAQTPTDATKGFLHKMGEEGSARSAALWGGNAGLFTGLTIASITEGRPIGSTVVSGLLAWDHAKEADYNSKRT